MQHGNCIHAEKCHLASTLRGSLHWNRLLQGGTVEPLMLGCTRCKCKWSRAFLQRACLLASCSEDC